MAGFEVSNRTMLPSPAVVTCKTCSASIPIRMYAQSRYVACGSCRKLWDVSSILSGKWNSITEFRNNKITPWIPVGTKGKLRGVIFEVVGLTYWKELGPDYYWNEYILFNPVHGYAFLNEYNGHWNFTEPVTHYPHVTDKSREFTFESEHYQLYLKYRATPVFALGEFAWRITDDRTVIEEFVSAPYVIVKQKKTHSNEWFKGEYIKAGEIKAAFNIEAPAPEQIGIGATQPMPFSDNIGTLKIASILTIVLITLFQFFISFNSKEEVVFQNTYNLSPESSSGAVVTPAFTINPGVFNTSNLEFYLHTQLSDDWFETEVTLINDQSGEEYQVEIGVEFYDGFDGGEYWKEGSMSETRFLSAIPAGTYHLNIFPTKGNPLETYNYSIQVRRDVPMWSNFFLVVLAIAIFPAIQWWREDSFEKQRWINSNYSPYE